MQQLRAWLLKTGKTKIEGGRFCARFTAVNAGYIDLHLRAGDRYPGDISGEVGKPTEHENMDKLLSEGYIRCYKPTSTMGSTLSPP